MELDIQKLEQQARDLARRIGLQCIGVEAIVVGRSFQFLVGSIFLSEDHETEADLKRSLRIWMEDVSAMTLAQWNAQAKDQRH